MFQLSIYAFFLSWSLKIIFNYLILLPYLTGRNTPCCNCFNFIISAENLVHSEPELRLSSISGWEDRQIRSDLTFDADCANESLQSEVPRWRTGHNDAPRERETFFAMLLRIRVQKRGIGKNGERVAKKANPGFPKPRTALLACKQ